MADKKKATKEKVEEKKQETQKEVQDMADDVITEEKDVKEDKKEKKAKKKFSPLKFIIKFLGVFLLLIILWLGWLGFIPVLSNILGAHSARDLGVEFTEADLTSFYDKTGQEVLNYANAPLEADGGKTIFADPADFDNITITQEEITARIDDLSEWVYMPVKNVQVAFGDDNVIEVSGNLVTDVVDEFVNFIGGVGYSQEDVQTGLDWVGRFAGDPAIYLKTKGSITNNQLSLELIDAKIGRWTPPMDEALNVLTTGTINAIAGVNGLDVDTTTFTDGNMHFDGAGPTTIYVRTE